MTKLDFFLLGFAAGIFSILLGIATVMVIDYHRSKKKFREFKQQGYENYSKKGL